MAPRNGLCVVNTTRGHRSSTATGRGSGSPSPGPHPQPSAFCRGVQLTPATGPSHLCSQWAGRTDADLQNVDRMELWRLRGDDPLPRSGSGSPLGASGPTVVQMGSRWTRCSGAVQQTIDTMLAIPEPGDIALFAHGHSLRALAGTWLGLGATGGQLLQLGTGTNQQFGLGTGNAHP